MNKCECELSNAFERHYEYEAKCGECGRHSDETFQPGENTAYGWCRDCVNDALKQHEQYGCEE